MQSAFTKKEIATSLIVHDILKTVTDCLWSLDLNSNTYLYVSPKIKQLYGYPIEIFKADTELWLKVVHPDDKLKVERHAAEMKSCKRHSTELEYRIVTANGTIKWLRDRKKLHIDEYGIATRIDCIATDITEQKKALENVARTERKYREVFEGNPVAMLIFDPETLRIMKANEEAVKLFGYSYDELKTMPYVELKLEEDRIIFYENLKKVKRNNPLELYTRIRKKNGKPLNTFQVLKLIELSDFPNPVIIVSYNEVAKRTFLNMSQLRSNHQSFVDFKSAVDQANIVCTTDTRGNYTYVNDNFVRISQYNVKELIGKHTRTVNSGYHPQSFFKELWTTISAGNVWRGDIKNKTKDGSYYWLNTHIIPFKNEKGKVLEYMAVSHDITEKIEAEEKLIDTAKEVELSNERFKLAAKATNDAIWDWDIENNKMYWGDGFESLFRYNLKSVKPDISTWKSHLHPDDIETVLKSLQQAIDNPTADQWEREYQYKKADGSYATVFDRARILRNQQGKAIKIVGAMTDITERKRHEAEIKKLNNHLEQKVAERTEELVAANKGLESFSYSVSHDLRAPLRSIDGFSKALMEDYHNQLDDDGKKYLQRIRNATHTMAELIDDMLRLSTVSRQQLKKESINLSAMANEIIYDMFYNNSQVKPEIIVMPDMKVIADKHLLKIALHNMIENAVKFSSKNEHAKITIGYKNEGDTIIFFVQDNGIGFNMKHADKLFGAFQRIHSDSDFQGTGIGLSIVHKVIQRHGGNIWAEAEPNKGATFFFTL
jgi:PAS domain S-box-containing protein